ncbi:MAG: DUF5683 domain-containing protein [Chitinophagales bacterium]
MKSIFFIPLLLFFVFPKVLLAQAEVYTEPKDTLSSQVEVKEVSRQPKKHSPKKAVIFSAVLPGLGQIYNKKYWKLPIIYAGFGGLGYSIYTNTQDWRMYRDAYKLRVDGDPNTVDEFEGSVSENNLLELKNHYKRNIDLSVIFTAVLYALNLVDAAVDAHLFNYDISDDLSMHVQPDMGFHSQRGSATAGVSIIFRL